MFDSGGIHLSLLTRLQARGAKHLPGNSSQSKSYTIPHIKELYTRKKMVHILKFQSQTSLYFAIAYICAKLKEFLGHRDSGRSLGAYLAKWTHTVVAHSLVISSSPEFCQQPFSSVDFPKLLQKLPPNYFSGTTEPGKRQQGVFLCDSCVHLN